MSSSSTGAEPRSPGSLPGRRPAVALLVSAAITTLTLVVAFGLLALDVEYFWVVFILGFAIVLPTALGIVTLRWTNTDRGCSRTGRNTDSQTGRDARTPLEELRMRYARGELTEAEFERRVALILEESNTNHLVG